MGVRGSAAARQVQDGHHFGTLRSEACTPGSCKYTMRTCPSLPEAREASGWAAMDWVVRARAEAETEGRGTEAAIGKRGQTWKHTAILLS